MNSPSGMIQVTMIGVSGSGKTSFMSGMYEALGVGDGVSNFRITPRATNPVKQNIEFGKWETISFGEDIDFPPGTTKTTTWNFDLRYLEKIVTTFNWLDYRGGILKETRTDNIEELEEILSHIYLSDVVILAVDSFVASRYDNVRQARLRSGARIINSILQSHHDHHPDKELVVVIALTKADSVAEELKGSKDDHGRYNYQPLVEKGLDWFRPVVDIVRLNIGWIGGIVPVSAVGEGNVVTRVTDEGDLRSPPRVEDTIVEYPEPLNIEHVLFYSLGVVLQKLKRDQLREIKEIEADYERALKRSNLATDFWAWLTDKPSPREIARVLANSRNAAFERLQRYEGYITPLYQLALEQVRLIK